MAIVSLFCVVWWDLVGISKQYYKSRSSAVVECTGVGSGGYAGDLTPPTIYVEGILICISPVEKNTYSNSHANCKQHVAY